jgi:hypothetical protein
MTSDAQDLPAVIQRLEKRQRRLAAVAGAAVVVAIASFTVSVSLLEEPAKVHAREFALLDENGIHRASLSMNDEGPALALSDASGTCRAALAVANSGPGLSLHDSQGRPRGQIKMTDECFGLDFVDPTQNQDISILRLWLAIYKDRARFGMRGKDSYMKLSLDQDDSTPALFELGDSPHVRANRVQLCVNDAGGHVLSKDGWGRVFWSLRRQDDTGAKE